MAKIELSGEGLSEMQDFLRKLEEETEARIVLNRCQDEIHDAILASMKNQEALIPKDSGALKKSLLDKNDRAHVFERISDTSLVYGSSLPQAKIQKVRIPQPSTQAILDILEIEFDKILKGDI